MRYPALLQIDLKTPQWKIPVTASVLVHLLVVLLIFLLAPAAKEVREKSVITRLVTPDEWMKEFPSRSRTPSDIPPRQLYGSARGHPAPAAPQRKVMPQKAVPSPPAPLSVQPRAVTPERTVPPITAGGGLPESLPSVTGKGEGVSPRKGHGAADLPKIPGIPAPAPSLRERLFDPEVVGKIAKREEKTHDSSITFDAGEFRYEGYMNKLKEKIESIWIYPRDAAMRGIQGDLKIRFVIKKNGKLGDVEVIRTSGYRNLDEAAIRALKDGDPFWPLPGDWGKDSLTITGHFIYSIYGTYIR